MDYEIEEIQLKYKARVADMAAQAPKTKPNPKLQAYIDNAYALGQKAREQGINSYREAVINDDYFCQMDAFELPEMAAFEAGILGHPKPYWVNGWRYGEIPQSGVSRNFAEDRGEPGVSFMGTDNGAATDDPGFELFSNSRKIIFGSGFINTNKTGSDGEPLLMWAVKTGEK